MSYLQDLQFTRGSDGSLDCVIVEGDIPLVSDRDAVRQRVESRCFTRLSRWISDPWLGSKMAELSFAALTDLQNALARRDILRALQAESWIVRNKIQVKVGSDIEVQVQYLDGQPESFRFTLAEV